MKMVDITYLGKHSLATAPSFFDLSHAIFDQQESDLSDSTAATVDGRRLRSEQGKHQVWNPSTLRPKFQRLAIGFGVLDEDHDALSVHSIQKVSKIKILKSRIHV